MRKRILELADLKSRLPGVGLLKSSVVAESPWLRDSLYACGHRPSSDLRAAIHCRLRRAPHSRDGSKHYNRRDIHAAIGTTPSRG
jgi:hypothetical protein